MHYIHDNEVDSILEVPSGTADQLTKLQQFLLKENNDFREVDPLDDSNAVPYFTVKDSDLDFREQFIEKTDKSSNTNSELAGDSDAITSLGKQSDKNSVFDYHSDKISDTGEHTFSKDVWPYLSADEELWNTTSVSEEDEEEEEEGKSARRRRKRSQRKWKYLQRGSEKTMEMLVVVDKTMMDRHGNKNITTYTLTLFNMVCITGWPSPAA